MPPKLHIPDGTVFNRYTTIKEVERDHLNRRNFLCRCKCGKIRNIQLGDLTSGNRKSCGCLKSEKSRNRMTTHGLSKTPEHGVWEKMRNRCDNPKDKAYKFYGGKGVKVCPRWRDFVNFIADMGERPQGTSLDRINSKGDYEPSNCRWASPLLQANNKSNTMMVTYGGETRPVCDWAREKGIPSSILRWRIHRGWDLETAMTASVSQAKYLIICKS